MGAILKQMRHIAIAAFFVALLQALLMARIGLDIHHDGTVLKPALDVASGQALFRETFSQYGPLTVHLQALFVRVFGPGLLSIKIGAAVFYGLSAAVLALWWGMYLPRLLVGVSLAIWLLLAPYLQPDTVLLSWASVFALFFQVSAAAALCVAFGARSPGRVLAWAIASGVSAGLTFWCRQPVGIVTLLGLGGVAFLRLATGSPRLMAGFFLGATLCSLGMLGVLARSGAIGFWIEQNFVWPRAWASQSVGFTAERVLHYLLRYRNESLVLLLVLALARPALSAAKAWSDGLGRKDFALALAALFGVGLFWRYPLRPYSTGGLTLLPLFGLFVVPWLLWRFKEQRWQMWTACVVAVSSWAQFYPVNDSRHVYWAISPAIGLFVFWVHRWLGSRDRWTLAAFVPWLVSIGLSQLPAAVQKLQQPGRSIDDPVLRGIRLPLETADALEKWSVRMRELSSSPRGPRPVVMEGPDVLYSLFTTDLRNPHRLPMIWKFGGMRGTHFDDQGRRFIRENAPLVVVQDIGGDVHQGGELAPGLGEYAKDLVIRDPDRGAAVALWVIRR